MQQRKLPRTRHRNRVFHTFTLAARPEYEAWFSFTFLSIASERERPVQLWLRARGSQRGLVSRVQKIWGPLSIITRYRYRSRIAAPCPAHAPRGAAASGPLELFEFKPPRLKYPFKPPRRPPLAALPRPAHADWLFPRAARPPIGCRARSAAPRGAHAPRPPLRRRCRRAARCALCVAPRPPARAARALPAGRAAASATQIA